MVNKRRDGFGESLCWRSVMDGSWPGQKSRCGGQSLDILHCQPASTYCIHRQLLRFPWESLVVLEGLHGSRVDKWQGVPGSWSRRGRGESRPDRDIVMMDKRLNFCGRKWEMWMVVVAEKFGWMLVGIVSDHRHWQVGEGRGGSELG